MTKTDIATRDSVAQEWPFEAILPTEVNKHHLGHPTADGAKERQHGPMWPARCAQGHSDTHSDTHSHSHVVV